MSVRRFLAIAPWSSTKRLYCLEFGLWIDFPTQPILDAVAGTLIIGLSQGKIIVWRGAAGPNKFGHYDPVADAWTYKDSGGSQDHGGTCSGNALDDEHVYTTGAGYVQKYQESTGVWTSLTPGGPLAGTLYRILPVAADELWVGGVSAHLWYYTVGGGWVNRIAELPAIGGWPVTAVRDMWMAPSGNIYAIAYVGATATAHLLRYDGAWTVLGNIGAGAASSIWGTDDTHIWIVCDHLNIAIRFWNGVAFSTESTNASGTHSFFAGRRVIGLSATDLVAVSYPAASTEIIRTSAPPAWAADALPGGWPPYAVGIQESTDATGPTITPIDPVDGQTNVHLDSSFVLEITDPSGLLMVGEGSPSIELDGTQIWSAKVPMPPYSGSLVAIPEGYRFTVTHPTFLLAPDTEYHITASAEDLNCNTSTLTYAFRTEPLYATPSRIGVNGGYEIVLHGNFPIGVGLPVRIEDALCYGGPGLGHAGQSADGSTLTVYSPPLPEEGYYSVTVEMGGLLVEAGMIEVVEVPVKTSSDAGQRTFAPWMATGPRR